MQDLFESQNDIKYLGDEHVDVSQLLEEFPKIHEIVYQLRIQYILQDQV